MEIFENHGSNMSSFCEMQQTISKMFTDTPVPNRDWLDEDSKDLLNSEDNVIYFSREVDPGKLIFAFVPVYLL